MRRRCAGGPETARRVAAGDTRGRGRQTRRRREESRDGRGERRIEAKRANGKCRGSDWVTNILINMLYLSSSSLYRVAARYYSRRARVSAPLYLVCKQQSSPYYHLLSPGVGKVSNDYNDCARMAMHESHGLALGIRPNKSKNPRFDRVVTRVSSSTLNCRLPSSSSLLGSLDSKFLLGGMPRRTASRRSRFRRLLCRLSGRLLLILVLGEKGMSTSLGCRRTAFRVGHKQEFEEFGKLLGFACWKPEPQRTSSEICNGKGVTTQRRLTCTSLGGPHAGATSSAKECISAVLQIIQGVPCQIVSIRSPPRESGAYPCY
jgi:hypothetical protein